MEDKVLRIYGKKRIAKRFKALDYKYGVFVGSLIHATFWTTDMREHVQGIVDYMNRENEAYVFELRTI